MRKMVYIPPVILTNWSENRGGKRGSAPPAAKRLLASDHKAVGEECALR